MAPASSIGEASEEREERSRVPTDIGGIGIRARQVGDGDFTHLACESAERLPLDRAIPEIGHARLALR